uniref:Uncharacterized protein n=2 Tax=Picea TaxID=3328 RepID=A0A101LXQ5_PICGL|nr:hypothetical protein ABT39_MTgene5450 [Picea glauca]QHR91510.1 hypothetical protein Q903MT_gene5545 [Picea sitchensis]
MLFPTILNYQVMYYTVSKRCSILGIALMSNVCRWLLLPCNEIDRR